VDNQVNAADIEANLKDLRARIASTAVRAGRAADDVTLVAVSKTHPMAAIEAAYVVGQRDFGENRVEELWEKVRQAAAMGLDDVRWHLIGTVQSRKSDQAVGPFAMVHSVDRLKLASRLSRDAATAGRIMDILLEVNVSGEESKHGFSPQELDAVLAEVGVLPGLRVRGFMTMAPLDAPGELARPTFLGLRELRDRLQANYPEMDLSALSMGMTNDFEVAIEEGATLVRVGSAIFGARPTQ
jgi:PLP dependent protein